jgi:hypothetical protein
MMELNMLLLSSTVLNMEFCEIKYYQQKYDLNAKWKWCMKINVEMYATSNKTMSYTHWKKKFTCKFDSFKQTLLLLFRTTVRWKQ